ncbi:hypothetical protein F5884DRAFT_82009 [Xylogone sp. PMI_703]|nr:hypothetical protein F5884DRAFT_82009 [Xylogone sp. PMI_703]
MPSSPPAKIMSAAGQASDAEQHTTNASPPATRSTAPLPLDAMRAYRACLNCRNRKCKCDLAINGGRPPCRRCQRELRECILGGSNRGGRRVRKKPKLSEGGLEDPVTPQSGLVKSTKPDNEQNSIELGPTQDSQTYTHQYEQPSPFPWLNTPSLNGGRDVGSQQAPTNLLVPGPQFPSPQYSHHTRSKQFLGSKLGDRDTINENIASVDLQNPSDALEILAQVADRAEGADSPRSDEMQTQTSPNGHGEYMSQEQNNPPSNSDDQLHYKPIQDGLISAETVCALFSTYEQYFHPYFPVIPRETFVPSRLPWISRNEPHLFSAILTIASKDNEHVHQICYDHMQGLISLLLAGADADTEAVEALLLLSQWVSHRPQAQIPVGRGEEDRVAWMYIGTALRLGYFLGLDRTSFKNDSTEDIAVFNRKRLVWAACYICDRQVSVRLGKGFWSRGPGPLSGLKSTDFPALQPTDPNGENWALIFQANLELTQIFSNVHDILYSSKGHGWKEMLEGRYAKYLDDFRYSIRAWNDVWGTLICSSRLKTSLLLSYDYLRLYVNAFAYQATISRALTYKRDSQHTPNRPIPQINASAPDARFIYEALDAAKSLLSTFNNFVEPSTLRYMPSSYYLYIIYSAVFLYKARSTTTMTDDERTGVQRMIHLTIERLQKASAGMNHMGSRYARLLQLLWRKTPKQKKLRETALQTRNTQSNTSYSNGENTNSSTFASSNFNGNGITKGDNNNGEIPPNTSGTFSWLDLGATWNFATQNNSVSGNASDSDDLILDAGMGPFDMSLSTDYTLLDVDNPNFLF